MSTRTKCYVLVPVEVELLPNLDADEAGDPHVGTIRMPSEADIQRALKECNSFMAKDDAWEALTG